MDNDTTKNDDEAKAAPDNAPQPRSEAEIAAAAADIAADIAARRSPHRARVEIFTDGDTKEIHVAPSSITSGEDLHELINELIISGHAVWGNHSGLYVEQAPTERTDVPETLIDPESRPVVAAEPEEKGPDEAV